MTGLTLESLTVRFDGLVAVDDVTLHAPMGVVTGLIGILRPFVYGLVH